VGFTRSAPSTTHELLDVESPLTCEHVVDGTAQSVGQDAQRLGPAVLAPQPFDDCAPVGALAQKRHRGFREGPLQMDVANLRAPGAVALAGGLPSTLHQAAVGGKILHGGEAV